MTDKTMTDEYAKLSLFAGMFAAAADWHLGVAHFAPLLRAHAWTLTTEQLAEWKMEALRLGVPADVMEPSEAMKRAMPELVRIGLEMQKIVDQHQH